MQRLYVEYMPFIPPLTLFTIGWLIGVGVAPLIEVSVWVWVALGIVAVLAAAVSRNHVNARTALISFAFLAFGGARFLSAQPSLLDPNFIASYNDGEALTIEGIVIDEPDGRDAAINLRVQVESVRAKNFVRGVEGSVLIQAPRYPLIEYGARVRAFGVLQTPPTFEDFSYRDFLARQGIYSTMYRARVEVDHAEAKDFLTRVRVMIFKPIFALKAYAIESILKTFPEPQGALISGILLGVDSNIPESLREAFRVTGTSHIVAISGFNISIIAGIVSALFRKLFSERRAIFLAITAIAVYSIMAGASASVVRAAIMGSLVLLANGFRRPTYGLNSLAVAAFAMTLFNPNTLWDVGFQLSAGATLGLILYAEPFTQAATRALARLTSQENAQKIIGTVGEFSLLTIAAQITTMPLIAFYFKQISLVSLAANLIVLPVQPQVMVLSGVAAIGAMINSSLGWLLYWLAYPFVTFTVVAVETLARVPSASIPIDRFESPVLFGMYAGIFGLTWMMSRDPIQRPAWMNENVIEWAKNIGVAATAVAALVLWNLSLRAPDGNLYVTFFDVGQGDAILIQTPSGRYALIDGGPSVNRLAEMMGRDLPFGTREIDLVISASPTNESVTGLTALLDRYTVNQVIMAGDASRSNAYREWADKIASRSIPTFTAQVGQRFDLGDSAILSIVAVNPKGATLRLDYKNASFLFPVGAINAVPLAQIKSVVVLLAPDNGASASLNANQVKTINPYTVVISVGAGNASGDPQPEILNLLKDRSVLRTDHRGTIKFGTNGAEIWAESER